MEPNRPTDQSHQRGQRLRELFQQALELPEASRQQFVRDHCDDRELCAELERLLTHDAEAEADDFLHAPTLSLDDSSGLPADAGHIVVGQQLGAYHIDERIARGGMGDVYRATRVDDYRQVVAIKTLRCGLDSQESLRRFAVERQILAELDHPCIAQILDAGTTGAGVPYCVMEYIEGGSIDRYCGEHRLSLHETTELFVQVCGAVQHAHEKGILHRDIKPGNILVTKDGIPKVTDFGVARWLDGDTDETRTGVVLGTPSYGSPEQVSAHRDQVGPRSDVFSLGALLYTLLTDQHAFKGDTWSQTIDLVCNTEPRSPRSLREDLPVDVESICLKCLQKEPHLRYESVQTLADDCQRWLDGLPIHARPIGPLQRLSRAYRRNRRAALLVTLAVVASIGGLATAIWFGIYASNSQLTAGRAVSEKRLAQQLASAQQLETQRQTALAATHAERVRRQAFNLELPKIQQICDSRSDLALERLADPELCPPDLRNFAWQHLRQRSSRHRLSIPWRAHHTDAPVMAFSPDDAHLISLSTSALNVWNSASGEHIKTRQGAGRGMVFLTTSASGSAIAAQRHDGEVALFRNSMSEVVVKISTPRESQTCSAITDDGNMLAIGTEDGRVELWNLRESRLLTSWTAHPGNVLCLEFSGDEERLISYGRGREIKSWEIPSGRPIESRLVSDPNRHFAVLSKGGDRLAVGEKLGRIFVKQCATNALLAKLSGVGDEVPHIAFSRDGQELAATARVESQENCHVWIWDTGSFDLRLRWAVPGVRELAFSNGGQLLATSSLVNERASSIDVWDIRPRVGVQSFASDTTGKARSATWLADGRLLCGGVDGSVSLVDVEKSQRHELYKFGAPVQAVASTVDGRLVAAASGSWSFVWSLGEQQSDAPMLSVSEGDERGGTVHCVAFSRTDPLLAVATRDGTINLWNFKSRELQHQFKARQSIWGLSFTQDGKTLVTCGRDRNLTLLDVATGEQIALLQGHTGLVKRVAISPDGNLVASASRDGTVRLWDLLNQEHVATLLGHSDRVIALAFSPDGATLASGSRDRTVRLWDVVTGDQQLVLEGHSMYVSDVAFSSDGRTLASCDESGNMLLWTSRPSGE